MFSYFIHVADTYEPEISTINAVFSNTTDFDSITAMPEPTASTFLITTRITPLRSALLFADYPVDKLNIINKLDAINKLDVQLDAQLRDSTGKVELVHKSGERSERMSRGS